MGKAIKIVISLALAIIVAGGYVYYVNASSGPSSYVTVAATNIPHGEKIQAEQLRQVAVHGDTPIQSIQAEETVDQIALRDIEAGEVITDWLITSSYDEDERLYTIEATYTAANVPVIRPGMEVEVWVQAADGKPAAQVTTAKVYTINGTSDEIEPGSDVSVTLQVHQNTIEPLEDARAQAPLFLVVKGEDVH